MRVGLVLYGSLDTVSGGYLYDRQLAGYLTRQGDTVEVIALPWRTYGRHLTDNLSADLLSRLDDDFDVLLQDELNHPSLAWINARRSRRTPVISIVHHLRSSEAQPRLLNALYRRVERRYLRSVDGYIFNSHATRRAVEALVGAGRPGIVAYPGGDRLAIPDRAGRPINSGPLRLLFVGNLIPRKGLHVLLAALARLSGNEWRLTIVGRPADPIYARRMLLTSQGPPLAGRVVWRGGLDDAVLASEMAAADVLVVPSSYEGFGIVYLEGMAFGLPAVATTAGGAGEIISDGQDGFLVPPGDAAALAERIALLVDNRARLAQMSAAAAARFARHPTWAQTTAAIRAFLVSLAKSPIAVN